jgi:hypothetical protein
MELKKIKTAPLILIHYGDSAYLKYTLKNAVELNSDKTVYLLGDSQNAHYESIGLVHYNFDELVNDQYVEKFNKVYRWVGGKDFHKLNESKKGRDWTWFNFIKWNVLLHFCKKEEITSFWIFDSDVIYCKPLSSVESYYTDVDYTVCNVNLVMQGLVNNIEYLHRFSQLAIEMFTDNELMNELVQGPFKANPLWGFTMMRVFSKLVDVYNPEIVDLGKEKHGTSLDFNISDGSTESLKFVKHDDTNIKKVWISPEGKVFQKMKDGTSVDRFAINLSWVPTSYIENLTNHIYLARKRKLHETKEISINPTASRKIKKIIHGIFSSSKGSMSSY